MIYSKEQDLVNTYYKLLKWIFFYLFLLFDEVNI